MQHQYVIIEMVTGTAMARATPTIPNTIEVISLVVNPGIVLVVAECVNVCKSLSASDLWQ